MEQTTRLDLYKLANGDYANHWETPTNANMQAIDDEFAGLATELVGSTTGAFTGLKGTEASLVDRLNNAMEDTGDIKYNSGDLDKSCHQMDGFETTEINDRLSNIDRREFVNARLRYLQRTIASGEFIKNRESYTGPTGVEANRYVSEFGIGLNTCLFDIVGDVNAPTQDTPGVLSINPLGWCSINGQLYYHKNTSYSNMVSPNTYLVILSPDSTALPGTIDNRLIRSHVATGNTGDTTIGGSLFASVGIGAVSSVIANNDWQPEVFQILRIEVTPGVFDEYLIKAVNAGSVEIYGEFPYNPGLVGRNWWILDYTIPCVTVSTYTPGNISSTMSSFYTYSAHFLHSHAVAFSNAAPYFNTVKIGGVSATLHGNPLYKFIDCTSIVTFGAVTANKATLVASEGPFRIKNVTILCMEANNAPMGPAYQTEFMFASNPCRLLDLDIGGVPTPCLIPSVTASIKRLVKSTPAAVPFDTWWNYGNDTMATTIEFVCHGALGDATEAWIEGADNGSRLWWGVLIEYA